MNKCSQLCVSWLLYSTKGLFGWMKLYLFQSIWLVYQLFSISIHEDQWWIRVHLKALTWIIVFTAPSSIRASFSLWPLLDKGLFLKADRIRNKPSRFKKQCLPSPSGGRKHSLCQLPGIVMRPLQTWRHTGASSWIGWSCFLFGAFFAGRLSLLAKRSIFLYSLLGKIPAPATSRADLPLARRPTMAVACSGLQGGAAGNAMTTQDL